MWLGILGFIGRLYTCVFLLFAMQTLLGVYHKGRDSDKDMDRYRNRDKYRDIDAETDTYSIL